ncbi:MAG TPA: LysM peptidoglycan-binding domain-containing protein [Anaerolineae bacterium]|nr:LysM peptidoglycan-binding domain-containing protein [Anaerolineae bacterium]HQH38175.1 LysM peptidoglycan-binding domain-containing protein [Anaerolineae bacterium]
MNAGAIVVLVLIAMAIVWAFWLIFKRDLMANNLGKLLTYFAGVILTLLIVLWITSRFLPWWAVRLVRDTQQSPTAQELQVVSADLFKQIVTSPGLVVTTPTPVAVTTPVVIVTTPGATVSPVTTPASGSMQTVPLSSGERTHTVQSGETLYSLSRKYGVTVDQLRQRNNLTGDLIRVGQQLIIP